MDDKIIGTNNLKINTKYKKELYYKSFECKYKKVFTPIYNCCIK